MLTINVKQRCVRDCTYKEIAAYSGKKTASRVSYVLGLEHPNFPVPAVALEAKFFSKKKTQNAPLLILHRTHSPKWHAVAAWWGDE